MFNFPSKNQYCSKVKSPHKRDTGQSFRRHTLTHTTTPFTFFHVNAGTALTGCYVLVHDMWGISKTSLAQAQITIASFVRS
jgi:hypothetical protein